MICLKTEMNIKPKSCLACTIDGGYSENEIRCHKTFDDCPLREIPSREQAEDIRNTSRLHLTMTMDEALDKLGF